MSNVEGSTTTDTNSVEVKDTTLTYVETCLIIQAVESEMRSILYVLDESERTMRQSGEGLLHFTVESLTERYEALGVALAKLHASMR